MDAQPFQFAIQATPRDGREWLAMARRVEELGYAKLMMADSLELRSPLPALALAAGATTSLRVGTFVLASPLRSPRLAAWDAHSLWSLSGGRFELGIGTGRPDVAEQATRLLGQPDTTPAQRLALVEATIDELRALEAAGEHTPVLIAAGGPRARAIAAAKADIVTLAFGPLAGRDEVARLVAEVREAAAGRDIEFAAPIFVVGDEVPARLRQFLPHDMSTLVDRDSLMIVRGSPRQMADELERRREEIGFSQVSVNDAFIEQFAPVVELLSGR